MFGFRFAVLGKRGLKGGKKYRQSELSIKLVPTPLDHCQQEITLNYVSLTFQKRKFIYCFNSIICQEKKKKAPIITALIPLMFLVKCAILTI